MPTTRKRTYVKRGKWAAYNARRRADREADNRKRLARRLERIAAADAALLAEVAATPPSPRVRKRDLARPLRLRLSVEITEPGGERHRHAFTATWCAAFGQWSVPASRITAGLAALMARAPEIARV